MSWRTVVELALASVAMASMFIALEKIEQSEVPSAVLKAVAARYPEARMGQFEKENEDGKLVYEVQLDFDGKRVAVSVSFEGEVLVEEQTIDIEDAPEAVRRSLAAAKYASANVAKVEKVTETGKEDAPTFEIVVVQGGRKHELAFEPTGELKKDEKVGKKKD